MEEVDYTMPLLVSGIFALLLSGFYLYKSENSTFMRLVSSWYMKNRYSKAVIQKDTRKQDIVLLVILIILISGFGLKLIGFAAVISDSMKPQFQRGDLVMTQSISKDPQIGDIITFKAANVPNPVTHRVIGVQSNYVSTKGDNNPAPDDYGTTKNDVISKAVVIEGHPVILKGVGSLFILDFSKEGKLSRFGDQYEFFQNLFMTIRTWGYVITLIAFSALILSMFGNKR